MRMRTIPTLGVLHIADLFRQPEFRLPSYRDWAKIPLILTGKWPKPIPKRTVLMAETHEEFYTWASQAKDFLAIDAEYSRNTRFLSVLGMGYPGCDTTFQVKWGLDTPRWIKDEFRLVFGDLIQRLPVVCQNALGAELPVIRQNLNFDYRDFKRIDDTMLAHHVLWSEWPHDLEFLIGQYGQYPKLKHLAREDLLLYNHGDVIETIPVWLALREELNNDPQSKWIYENLYLPCIPGLLKSQELGIKTIEGEIGPAKERLETLKAAALDLVQASAGFPLNPGSSKRLGWYLYDILGFREVKKRGKRTVDKDTLAHLNGATGEKTLEAAIERITEGSNPVLEGRVLYATALQDHSHYIKPLHLQDRIFPEVHIHAQANARWSIVKPPLAQLPLHLRNIIGPDVGTVWFGWDWDQIELRLNAVLSNDTPSLEAFAKGWDIHTLNTCDLFGLELPTNPTDPHTAPENASWRDRYNWQGKDDLRQKFAKTFVYRLDYGGKPESAGSIPGARVLGLDSKKLIVLSQNYLARHPGKAAWRARLRKQVFDTSSGFPEVRTFMGQRRKLLNTNGAVRIREAYDYPMQAGVSNIANKTFIDISNKLPWLTWMYGMHDSQWWQGSEEKQDQTWPLVKAIVEQPFNVGGITVVFPATFKERKCN